MVAEDEGQGPTYWAGAAPEPGQPAGSSPKGEGWYPTRANPSDQTYWDGQNWTARRRWTTGRGWVEAGDVPPGASAASAGPPLENQRLSANPFSQMTFTRSRPNPISFNLGVLILLVCGVALMYGSVGSWVHVSGTLGVANFHASINGLDPAISALIGVNGYVTFITGILLVIFAGLVMTSEEMLIAVFAAVIAAASTIFATYDMFRIVQKISQLPTSVGAEVSVGWGLICVLSASVLALLIAVVRLLQR